MAKIHPSPPVPHEFDIMVDSKACLGSACCTPPSVRMVEENHVCLHHNMSYLLHTAASPPTHADVGFTGMENHAFLKGKGGQVGCPKVQSWVNAQGTLPLFGVGLLWDFERAIPMM